MVNQPNPDLPPPLPLSARARKVVPVLASLSLLLGAAADVAHQWAPKVAGPVTTAAQVVSWVQSLFGG